MAIAEQTITRDIRQASRSHLNDAMVSEPAVFSEFRTQQRKSFAPTPPAASANQAPRVCLAPPLPPTSAMFRSLLERSRSHTTPPARPITGAPPPTAAA